MTQTVATQIRDLPGKFPFCMFTNVLIVAVRNLLMTMRKNLRFLRGMKLFTFSNGDVILMYSAYASRAGEIWALHSNCHTMPLKWCGIPLRTNSCRETALKIKSHRAKANANIVFHVLPLFFVSNGLATLNWPRFFPCLISETNGLVTYSKISQLSVTSSVYFYVNQIYWKQNRTGKQSFIVAKP